jgi:hypothetical protein
MFWLTPGWCAIIVGMNERLETGTDAKRPLNFLGIGLALVLAVAAFFSGMHIGTVGAADII